MPLLYSTSRKASGQRALCVVQYVKGLGTFKQVPHVQRDTGTRMSPGPWRAETQGPLRLQDKRVPLKLCGPGGLGSPSEHEGRAGRDRGRGLETPKPGLAEAWNARVQRREEALEPAHGGRHTPQCISLIAGL